MNMNNGTHRRDQAGVGIVMFVIAVLVVAVIGLAGYMVYQAKYGTDNDDSATNNSQTTGKQSELKADDAPEVKSTGDLDKAATTLDQIDSETDTSDTTQLGNQVKDL